MVAAMEDVVHLGGQGFRGNSTAWAYIGQRIGYRMAGKSGTAQVVEIRQGEEYNERNCQSLGVNMRGLWRLRRLKTRKLRWRCWSKTGWWKFRRRASGKGNYRFLSGAFCCDAIIYSANS